MRPERNKEDTTMTTFTVIADEINFKSQTLHSFEECRQLVEGKKPFDDLNKYVVVENNDGEVKIHEYFKIVIH